MSETTLSFQFNFLLSVIIRNTLELERERTEKNVNSVI